MRPKANKSKSEDEDEYSCESCKLKVLPQLEEGQSVEDAHFWLQCKICKYWFHGR